MTDTPDLSTIAFADAMVAEKALLGGIMLDDTILPIVTAKLEPADFQSTDHRDIYKSMLEISQFGIPVDFISVYEYVKRLEFKYFDDLYDHALPGHVDYLVRRIKDSSKRRNAQRSMMDSIQSLGNLDADVDAQLDAVMGDFSALMRDDTGTVTASEQVTRTMKRMDNQDEGEFVKIGLRAVDNTTGGAQRGEYWLIAGRPSMGKSSMAATCFLNMGRAKYPVCYVNVEGTRHSLMCRLMSIYTGIDLTKIRTGKLDDKEIVRIAHAGGVIGALPLFFIEETRWSKVRAHIQALKMRVPDLAAVFIDYIGLLELGRNYRERQQEVSFLSADIKRLGKDLNIVTIPLSQLNRQVEGRKDHRPMISDLRESGSLEQDADVILFPYRPGYYNEKVDRETDAEIAIAKNREGRTGTAEVKFEPTCVRFGERDS